MLVLFKFLIENEHFLLLFLVPLLLFLMPLLILLLQLLLLPQLRLLLLINQRHIERKYVSSTKISRPVLFACGVPIAEIEKAPPRAAKSPHQQAVAGMGEPCEGTGGLSQQWQVAESR